MAEKSSTPSSKAVKSSGWLMNLVCFVAVICIGVSLILTKIPGLAKIAGALTTIAQVLSYSALCIISCFYIIRKKNLWLWITWAVSVALIILFFII